MKTFLRWANSTLLGHGAYYGGLFALAESITGLYLNYIQHTLTATWATFVVLVCAIMGTVCAVLIWYTMDLPRFGGQFLVFSL